MKSHAAAFVCAILLILLLAAVVGAARAEALNFFPTVNYAVGSAPMSVAVADFNGDGKQDLVTANQVANTVSVLLGNGSGGFGTKADFSTDKDPWSVAVGDFNGDGKQDLTTANWSASTASVLLGNGSGGFTGGDDAATSLGPESVAVADFNGDGKQDLVTANQNAGCVSVLLGNGSGGFGTKTDFGTGSQPMSVAVADFNGDGMTDLAVANFHVNTASVLLQKPGPFTITPSVVGGIKGHGTISPATPQIVSYGLSAVFTFRPDAGYYVGAVAVDGAPVSMTDTSTYRFASVTADHTISVTFAVKPKPTVGVPIRPRSVRRGKLFTVYGTLKPHFPVGAKTVRVKAYRYASGRWTFQKTYTAVNGDFSTYTRYSASVRIWRKGKYRFKAFTLATADWASAKSGFSRTLTVK